MVQPQPHAGPAQPALPGEWWQEFRGQMPVADEWAYFDHAAVAPLSRPAHQALAAWSDDMLRHGDTHWKGWFEQVEAIRRQAARFIGSSPEELAFVPNTTAGINLVAEGFPWRAGDNVVVPENEFPSNLYPWMNLATQGVECRRVACDDGRLELDRLEAACDRRTRLIAVSWVGYSSGWRLDLDALAELARRRGALLFVDAIQGLGVFPLDVSRTRIDFLAADGHKWLLGPEGAGLFYLRREHLGLLSPRNVGWHSVVHAGQYDNTELALRSTALRYEGGTWNTGGILALGASLALLARYGTERLAARVLELAEQASQRLLRAGAALKRPAEREHQSGIVSFELPGRQPLAVRQACLARGVALACRAGRLRISPHAYNDASDLARLEAALREAQDLE